MNYKGLIAKILNKQFASFALVGGLLLLFTVLTIGNFSLSEKASESKNYFEQTISHLTAGHCSTSNHKVCNLPEFPGANTEDSSEKESDTNTEDCDINLSLNSELVEISRNSILKTSSEQLTTQLHNRFILSLIVLHHAWKSYLN